MSTLYTVTGAGIVAKTDDHQIRGDEHPSDIAVYVDTMKAPTREQVLALFAQAKAEILKDLS
jgi:hypothetical protein